jgi:hypothetical protein
MIPDSRTQKGLSLFPVYSTSAVIEDVYVWIQPSIGRQPLDSVGSTIVSEIYAQTPQLDVIPIIQRELEQEFAAWDAASDEALLLIELETY